ncbi:Spy/CpxP family protein refolding chaperone [Nevskia sp.]|uniref:Spy/CpxP family protein refolding chaperone n=1 Tax=Nevskia sp. TaxID=1929292 RepID=UPI0025E656C0|nr:Spy/CpxP family protein refolding chaperone [Nevskia sp.]
MLKLKSKSTLAAALVAGLMIAAPQFVSAQDAARGAAAAPEARAEHGGKHQGRGGHHGRHHGGPFMHQLKSLDLSEAQRSSIRTAIKASFESGKAQHESMRSLHRSMLTATPGSAGYGTLVNQLADAEANAARDRVQKMAALKGEIYAMLTDAQKTQLTEKLQNLPERGARGEKTGWKQR